MSSLPMASDDCDKVANVSIGRVRQASPEYRSGACGHPSGDWRLISFRYKFFIVRLFAYYYASILHFRSPNNIII
jgi:hypothetical protein